MKFSAILKLFESFGFPSEVSKQLGALCSLNGRLPQGAPTSPAISNLAFRPVDLELVKLARGWKCVYTRYADDLAFSGSRHFTKEDIRKVQRLIASHGFSLNRSKSRIIGSGGRQVVAGVVVNTCAQPPRVKRRVWRALFHRASKHPHEFCERQAYLQGVAALVNQYDGKLAAEYREIVQKVSKAS